MSSVYYLVALVVLAFAWVYRAPVGRAASFLVSSLNAFAKEYNDAYADGDESSDESAQIKED